MVGIDAGPKVSLQALNKQLAGKNPTGHLERLYEANKKAFDQARKVGLKLKVGFVIGHIGMTRELLQENIDYFCDLVGGNPDVACTVDIEILSPEPGSMEYRHLINPSVALEKASQLGLRIGDPGVRQKIADKWGCRDIIVREELIGDYVTAFMPDLTLDDLKGARKQMRDFCRARSVLIGEG